MLTNYQSNTVIKMQSIFGMHGNQSCISKNGKEMHIILKPKQFLPPPLPPSPENLLPNLLSKSENLYLAIDRY